MTSRQERRKGPASPKVEADVGGVGGILKGLAGLVEKLGELAETGRELSKTGEIRGKGPTKDLKGMYGFTVKVGVGSEGIKVEPFGNVRRDERTGRTEVEEVREPPVDVFEEEDHTLIVAEMPGIGVEDVRIEVKDDILTLTAEKGSKRYRKEILLPAPFPREKMQVSCTNGVVEIRCVK